MPYHLVKVPGGYYVETREFSQRHTDSEGQFHHIHTLHKHLLDRHHSLRHSKEPLSHEMALKQLRALYLHA
jgi:hypothetical protein